MGASFSEMGASEATATGSSVANAAFAQGNARAMKYKVYGGLLAIMAMLFGVLYWALGIE